MFPLVSFCTVCMGRLHHIKQTLIKNINDNKDYPNVEFVLLDYNSDDHLEDWVKENMQKYIDCGLLNYYKNPEPKFFHHSHAKNMALRLGTGEIVCSLDADNYTEEGFAYYISKKMKNIDFLVANYIKGDELIPINDSGICGRLVTFKKVFYSIGGYNEEMQGWGYEDMDINKRLFLMGYKGETIDICFLKCIEHDDNDRIKNLKKKNLGREDIKLNIEEVKINSGTCLDNYLVSKKNLVNGNIMANSGSVGCGRVYKNFSKEVTILENIDY